MKVKQESEKVGLKLNSENADHGIRSHHFIGNRRGNSGNSVSLYFGGSKITADGDCSHEIKRLLLLGPWQPTPVLLTGGSHGQRSLVGCSPWGHRESDRTERLHFHFHFHALEKEMATTPVSLPRESRGQGSLVGCHLFGRT